MANRELTIVLRARNMLAAGVKAAERQLNALASGIGSAFRTASRWVLGIGAAVGAVTAKALAAWSGQERATTALASAFRAYGEEVDSNVERLGKLASAIQDETAVADEVTTARMARLKMLGMETALLPHAAKGVIALGEAGMEEAAAMKALVAAQNGEFTMLGRYLPALRSATSASEKAAIVNDFLTKGYQASKDRLNTVGGAWEALKGRVGDVWEEIGKVLAQDAGLQSMLTAAGEKVKDLTGRFVAWAASGGMVNLIAGVKLFAENVRSATVTGWAYFAGFFKGGIMEPATQAWQYVSSVTTAWWGITKSIIVAAGEYFDWMWKKLKNPLGKIPAPDMSGPMKAAGDFWDALKGGNVDKSTAFAEMFASIEAEEKKHAARVLAISEKQRADLANVGKKRVADETRAMEQLAVARESDAERQKELAELAKRRNELNQKIAQEEAREIADADKQVQADKLQAEIDAAAGRADASKRTAGMRVADFIAEQRAGRTAAEQAKDDAGRAAELAGREARGTRLSKGDREWLDAMRAIEAAKLQAEIDAGEQIRLQNDLRELQRKDSGNLNDSRKALEEINARESELLKARP